MRGELDDGGDADGRGRRAHRPRRRPDAGWLLLAIVVPLAVGLAVAVPVALASSAGSGLRRASGAFSAPLGPADDVVLASTVAPDRGWPERDEHASAPASMSTVMMTVAQASVARASAPVVATTSAPVVPPTTTVAPIRLVSGVGDSIMLGATDELRSAVVEAGATFAVDARVGRPFGEGVASVARLVAAHGLGNAVVVHLGTNGAIDEAVVRSLLDQLVSVRRVVVVNVRAPVTWEASANETLAAVGATYANVRLVDWHGAGEGHDELFWSDGIHLRPAGNAAYARLLTAALFAP